MKTKIYQAFLVFMLVFCAPWAIASALQTYAATGGFIGKFVYEATHENS